SRPILSARRRPEAPPLRARGTSAAPAGSSSRAAVPRLYRIAEHEWTAPPGLRYVSPDAAGLIPQGGAFVPTARAAFLVGCGTREGRPNAARDAAPRLVRTDRPGGRLHHRRPGRGGPGNWETCCAHLPTFGVVEFAMAGLLMLGTEPLM